MHTFNSKYSSWYLELAPEQHKKYKKLERLVLSFNSDLRNQVIRAKEKFNLKVRGVISEKTGVSLSIKIPGLESKNIETVEKASIPIKIVDSVPVSLLRLFERFDDSQLELLLRYRKMKLAVEELKFQSEKYSDFNKFHLGRTKIESLRDATDHLNQLIFEVESCGILKAIKELGPDYLGSYFVYENRIELYWLGIGLCNLLYDSTIEDFTLIVLIHELVHGYTHIGFDKDGNNWRSEHFLDADLKIVEGFAQFYTEMICRDFFKEALEAFNSLLTYQSIEYTEYKNWFSDDEADKYEKARRILLKTRKSAILKYIDFENALDRVKKEI